MKEGKNRENKKDFEENMTRLKEVVKLLEEGNLSLEESLKCFEEGIGLYRFCNEVLNNAEQRISLLIEDDNEIKERPFEVIEEE
ncbi:exodeoxyribonuclease VII small subunit [Maledivibacter halophilus]|uniref:Exodeoxyribonuclease 7 small subunit n=1 Tax=Maledivibacter halophilus TaxID=36842 RepID=A0A1T5L878_9FIRM|nr:exodeoxyribonuclease VII small subunit [Maledivibacter halophilus]SKC72256.1 Exodeoxyribonuclease VII small subunit [Maledivibacter halophilus]